MEAAVARRLINSEDYYKMAEVGMLKPDERVELINGEIYAMAPSGSKHAAIIQRMARIFTKEFDQEYSIRTQSPLNVDEFNEPESDIAIVRSRSDDYFTAHPSPSDVYLLIEVSESSYSFDRQVKMSVFAKNEVPEIWIINLIRKRVEVYKAPSGSTYQSQKNYLPGQYIPFTDREFSVSDLLII